jgi:nitrogen fixation/metabolism regulation signal transduction histidine kinase
MKPLLTETQDAETLRQLGGASVQIVHDLKNQLNGLKLYATFLRKRLEKSDRPADELETITKLINGLERAAGDMTLLVRYGRPLELRRKPGTDLSKLLKEAAEGRQVEAGEGPFEGDFDPESLREALKNITNGGRAAAAADAGEEGAGGPVSLRREGAGAAVIEWQGVAGAGEDLFGGFAGGEGLRLALASKIIRAHGGEVAQDGDLLRARLPLQADDGR